jgi:uncharacterized protein (DUF849 family)
MLLQAALNGSRTSSEHPELPVAADELVADAVACVAAGARSIHLHPRGEDGAETLDEAVVDAVVARVRAACHAPVGVSTGAWIEPDPERRAALVGAWRAPDAASVNVAEDGFAAVMAALLAAGIGVEAGVWSPADAERLASSGFGGRVTRVLVEVIGVRAPGAVAHAAEIHAALDAAGIGAPRLQHAEGDATWPVLADAIARGLDTRIGLEDTLVGPDGTPAGNEALVLAARTLGAGTTA